MRTKLLTLLCPTALLKHAVNSCHRGVYVSPRITFSNSAKKVFDNLRAVLSINRANCAILPPVSALAVYFSTVSSPPRLIRRRRRLWQNRQDLHHLPPIMLDAQEHHLYQGHASRKFCFDRSNFQHHFGAVITVARLHKFFTARNTAKISGSVNLERTVRSPAIVISSASSMMVSLSVTMVCFAVKLAVSGWLGKDVALSSISATIPGLPKMRSQSRFGCVA